MSESALLPLSNDLADIVEAVAPSVVQVQGRSPVSGVIFAPDAVVTNARAIGREDGIKIRKHDGYVVDAELHGWDPTTGLAVLKCSGLGSPLAASTAPARVGNLALAVARSWSNSVTASVGLVSVIGGPLRTGRGRAIEQVIRTTAPMHEGFAGGAFVDMRGQLIGIATPAAIRGLGVIIPSSIALRSAQNLLDHGRMRQGYLGVVGQPVRLSNRERESGLLVAEVKKDSPAQAAGLLVGDVIVEFDGEAIESPDDLLQALASETVGKQIELRVLRGEKLLSVNATIGDR